MTKNNVTKTTQNKEKYNSRAENNKEKLAHNLRLNLSRRKQKTQEEDLLIITDE